MGNRIDVPIELEGFDVAHAELVDGVLEIDVTSLRSRPVTTADRWM